VTDGASLAVREVAHGDAVAAMALDFQARAEAAYSLRQSRTTARLRYAMPVGGTSISPDPISLMRGAKNRSLAVDFIRFVLSREGQRLYSYRIGEPGGPLKSELYRMPVRKDVYTAEDRPHMTDPELDPYAVAGTFVFHRQWTAPGYALIASMTRAVVLDPREELVAAWRAIIDAGGPERVPEAWAQFTWLPVPYASAADTVAKLGKDPIAMLTTTRAWTVEAQRRYRAAERLARAAIAGGAR
jgi:spermidine/putrescine-binding protein